MENKEEINKHLEGFVKYVSIKEKYMINSLKDYQKKHNLIPSIEVGKYYRYKDNVFKCTEIIKGCMYGYGFNRLKNFSNNNTIWSEIDSDLTEIPQEEWQSLLLEKAKKDYTKGTKFMDMYFGKAGRIKDEKYHFYNHSDGKSYISNQYGDFVFDVEAGQWASIIQEEETKKTDDNSISKQG